MPASEPHWCQNPKCRSGFSVIKPEVPTRTEKGNVLCPRCADAYSEGRREATVAIVAAIAATVKGTKMIAYDLVVE